MNTDNDDWVVVRVRRKRSSASNSECSSDSSVSASNAEATVNVVDVDFEMNADLCPFDRNAMSTRPTRQKFGFDCDRKGNSFTRRTTSGRYAGEPTPYFIERFAAADAPSMDESGMEVHNDADATCFRRPFRLQYSLSKRGRWTLLDSDDCDRRDFTFNTYGRIVEMAPNEPSVDDLIHVATLSSGRKGPVVRFKNAKAGCVAEEVDAERERILLERRRTEMERKETAAAASATIPTNVYHKVGEMRYYSSNNSIEKIPDGIRKGSAGSRCRGSCCKCFTRRKELNRIDAKSWSWQIA